MDEASTFPFWDAKVMPFHAGIQRRIRDLGSHSLRQPDVARVGRPMVARKISVYFQTSRLTPTGSIPLNCNHGMPNNVSAGQERPTQGFTWNTAAV
jgi:hypothetical protein